LTEGVESTSRTTSMKTIGAFEAKTHFSELLDLAAMGERYTITKRGKPVAMLVPLEEEPRTTPEEAVAAIRSARVGASLAGDRLKDLIEEGRR
jgi:prevent-host-death family protein